MQGAPRSGTREPSVWCRFDPRSGTRERSVDGVDHLKVYLPVLPHFATLCGMAKETFALQVVLLVALFLGTHRTVFAERPDWGLWATNALSLDDQIRWKAQAKLHDTKDKTVVPILIKSLDIEAQRTEEKLATHAGIPPRNVRLPIHPVVSYLQELGGKDVVPDLIRFKRKYPRYSWVIDQTIFELEHDTSKPVNTDTLRLSIHTETSSGKLVGLSHKEPGTESTDVFPADGHMAVTYTISSTQTNIPTFCAYAYKILIDDRAVYSSGAPHVWTGKLEGRVRRIPLKGLSNGWHTVTLRIAETDISSSTSIWIVPK